MSEFCDSVHAEITNVRRIGRRMENYLSGIETVKILQILYSNIALSSAMTAAIDSANHLDVKVTK